MTITDEMVEAADRAYYAEPATQSFSRKSQMRAALEAALARRLPPADNAVAWTKAERKAVAVEICLHWGETPWRVDAGGVEKWKSYLPLADAVLSEVSRLRPLLVATPSYAEGRAAGLREAAKAVQALTNSDTMWRERAINAIKSLEALIGAAR